MHLARFQTNSDSSIQDQCPVRSVRLGANFDPIVPISRIRSLDNVAYPRKMLFILFFKTVNYKGHFMCQFHNLVHPVMYLTLCDHSWVKLRTKIM